MNWPRNLKKATYLQASDMYNAGTINYRLYRQFLKIWCWSTVRYGDPQYTVQGAFAARFGEAAFWRRINRVRRVMGMEAIQ